MPSKTWFLSVSLFAHGFHFFLTLTCITGTKMAAINFHVLKYVLFHTCERRSASSLNQFLLLPRHPGSLHFPVCLKLGVAMQWSSGQWDVSSSDSHHLPLQAPRHTPCALSQTSSWCQRQLSITVGRAIMFISFWFCCCICCTCYSSLPYLIKKQTEIEKNKAFCLRFLIRNTEIHSL